MPEVGDTTIQALWRLVLCDLDGSPLSSLDHIALGRNFAFPLNRPARWTFRVPSDSPDVNITQDGDPYLSVGNRVLKAYRRMSNQTTWTQEFCGIVWDSHDVADGDRCTTEVNCYDPFQLLNKRLVRDADGEFKNTVWFEEQQSQEIAKLMVDRTIAFAGPCGIATTGTFTACPQQTWNYEQGYIAPSIISLCDTGLVDVWFDPVDQTDGTLVEMNAGPLRGQDRPNVVLAYAAPGRTAFSLDRTMSMEEVANSITLFRGSNTSGYKFAEDLASQTKYHVYEHAEVLSDVHHIENVEDLVNLLIQLRAFPSDMLTILPVPEYSPIPFRDFFLGDRIKVMASIGADQEFPETREALDGIQRVYGISGDVDDDGVEKITGLDVSPQGAS